jgi:hypothetical protein
MSKPSFFVFVFVTTLGGNSAESTPIAYLGVSTPLGLRTSSFFPQYCPHVNAYFPNIRQASTCSEGLFHDVRMMCTTKNSASEAKDPEVLEQILITLKNLEKGQIELKKEVQEGNRKVAGLSEASVRRFGADLFGVSFAKRHLARKMGDLKGMIRH